MKRRNLLFSLLFLLLLPAAPAVAEDYIVAGEGPSLWIVQREPENKFTIFLRHPALGPNAIARFRALEGIPDRRGVAAVGDQLWIVYQNHSVQSTRWITDPNLGIVIDDITSRHSLPAAELKSFAAGSAGPWALISTTKSGPAATSPSAPASIAAVHPEDQLLRYGARTWENIDLPSDWPHGAPAWLVMLYPGDPAPHLVVKPQYASLRVYKYVQASPASQPASTPASTAPASQPAFRWVPLREDGFPLANQTSIAPVAMGGQLTFAQVDDDPKDTLNLRLQLYLLRPEFTAPNPIGSLTAPHADVAEWTTSLAPLQDTVAIVTRSKDPLRYSWTRIDLTGRVTPATILNEVHPSPFAEIYAISFVVAVIFATLVMFFFWRRDPKAHAVKLPRSLVLADPLPRAAAGLIDLLPCIAATMFFFKADIGMLCSVFPVGLNLKDALATLFMIGLFVTHTGVAELFTGRSLGKSIMNLRVTTLTGEPPNIWQVLSRNLLKAIDIVAKPLLLLPLISPSRQRLGDMLARTVVVSPPKAPPPIEDDPDM